MIKQVHTIHWRFITIKELWNLTFFLNFKMSIVPHPPVFCKKGALKNLQNFAGKYLFWSLFLIKLQAFKRFLVKFAKFLKTHILKNICERLLLPFLGFTKLNHDVFLWISWGHRFPCNNIITCQEHMLPSLTSEKIKHKKTGR